MPKYLQKAALTLRVEMERWPLTAPFRIAGHTWESADVLVVSLERAGRVGRGEASGVYYKSDAPSGMLEQIESLRSIIEAGVDRGAVQRMLPPGGARNALDCALWDLEAKLSGTSVWELASLQQPEPVTTTFTFGAAEPEAMAAAAADNPTAKALKLKLTGEPIDAERVRAVRQARMDARIGVDGNQGFTRAALEHLMPVLQEARIALIEQPFAVGQEPLLDGFQSPIPIAADESAQCLADLPSLLGRFDVVNIKLDKCGGFTEALAMVGAARSLGLDIMVSNMVCTSLAMAPIFLLAQFAQVVDLDGPTLLKRDRPTPVDFRDGLIWCPEALWGYAAPMESRH